MKKILLFSACVMLAFASCKKSDKNAPAGSNTITANVDGNAVDFNNGATGLLSISQGGYVLFVSGFSGTGSSEQSMQIGIDSQKPITTGTYSLSSSTDPNATASPQLAYGLGAPTPIGFITDGVNLTTITITSISSTNVQGTFSGVLLSSQDATTTKSITNGKFNVVLITHNQ